ncbi:hypothetical protein BCV71DRAFT_258820 [Rhizopus microsporus]|uniref:Uncharacterized protein n=1 Tax=Rhizopus microsporus TaxID=58291 RepID=A0A1X0RM09_RHIZD|nr:hypothetical protein BCV71DRAFT_258820 [Rhizopus microsporus]
MELLELSRSLKLERDRRERNSCPLLDEILEDMEDTPQIELQANIKKFQREIVNYEGENWTRSSSLISRNSTWTHIPLLATRGRNGKEARDLSTKALRLPMSVRYLEDEDDEDKDMAFDVETVERIQQARPKNSFQQKPGGTPPEPQLCLPVERPQQVDGQKEATRFSHYTVHTDGITPGGRLQSLFTITLNLNATNSMDEIASRDLCEKNKSLVEQLNNVSGSAQDMMNHIQAANTDICLIVIDFAGLSRDSEDIRSFFR